MYLWLSISSSMRKYYLFIIGLLWLGCGDDGPTTGANGPNSSSFFPTNNLIREYQMFRVDIYNLGQTRDTFNYFLRERIIGTDVNSLGEEITVIEQSERTDPTQEWNIFGRVSEQVINGMAIRNEGNLSQVKLIVPPEEDALWQSTQRFDPSIMISIGTDEIEYFKDWESRYLDIDASFNINDLSFDRVISVQQAKAQNRLQYRTSLEHYAENIGLVSRVVGVFDTQCFENCESIPWEDKADIGQLIIQSLVNYSNE